MEEDALTLETSRVGLAEAIAGFREHNLHDVADRLTVAANIIATQQIRLLDQHGIAIPNEIGDRWPD